MAIKLDYIQNSEKKEYHINTQCCTGYSRPFLICFPFCHPHFNDLIHYCLFASHLLFLLQAPPGRRLQSLHYHEHIFNAACSRYFCFLPVCPTGFTAAFAFGCLACPFGLAAAAFFCPADLAGVFAPAAAAAA